MKTVLGINSIRRIEALWVAMCFVACFTQAQQKDTLQLQEVSITESRYRHFNTGNKTIETDSTKLEVFRQNNLADLLSQNNSLFIKSYGSGNIATTSIRGGGASHTAVLWNGFNINNPMLGQLDLSLLPVSFIDNASIQYGGSGTMWGSGAVGGSIHLNNQQNYNKGLSIETGSSYSSLNNVQQNLSLKFSQQKWISVSRAFYRDAKNNFSFYNTSIENSPLIQQKHGEQIQYGLLQDNYFILNRHQKINVHVWLQNSNRAIPPNMLQASATAEQADRSFKTSGEWQRTGDKIVWLARSAFFSDQIDYGDATSIIYSHSEAISWISEVESKINIGTKQLLNAGLNNTLCEGKTSSYINNRQGQNKTSLFASYKYAHNNDRFTAIASIRQEFVRGFTVPLTYSAGFTARPFNFLSLQGNVNKVYRLPTLNDLYWNPGGNPRLRPEEGYSEDIGCSLLVPLKQTIFKSTVSLFNKNIGNWIMWLPASGGVWSPQNIAKVLSRGLESNSSLAFHIKKFKLILGVSTNYVLSTNEKAKSENDESLGRQLIYVPMYSGAANVTIHFQQFYFNCNQTYTGYRYTSSDNYEYLRPYTLGNMQAAYKFFFKKYTLAASAQINNSWNCAYQVISQQAMPLRNFQIGLSINYHQENKHQ